MTSIPAWLIDPLSRLAGQGERIPHALLLHGQSGIGKRRLGRFLARALLCESPDEPARLRGGCGACPACQWFEQGNHPDFRRITSEAIAADEGQSLADDEAAEGEADSVGGKSKRAPSKEIKVEQVRALQGFLGVATHRSRARVVLLYPLEAVNTIAANALLKMLEEPPSRTVFVLVADHLGRIPATIVSRCYRVPIATPSPADAAAWLAGQSVTEAEALLALTGGAPFAALAAAADEDGLRAHRDLVAFLSQPSVEAALATAEAFGRSAPGPLVRWMQLWLADCLAARLANRVRYHLPQSSVIAQLAGSVGLDALTGLIRRVEATRRTVDHPLNTRLMLEGLFGAYADAMAAPARPA